MTTKKSNSTGNKATSQSVKMPLSEGRFQIRHTVTKSDASGRPLAVNVTVKYIQQAAIDAMFKARGYAINHRLTDRVYPYYSDSIGLACVYTNEAAFSEVDSIRKLLEKNRQAEVKSFAEVKAYLPQFRTKQPEAKPEAKTAIDVNGLVSALNAMSAEDRAKVILAILAGK